ncbi:cupin superfamily barrel domain protein [Syntrophotalea carbinolica DSM 2380]|uniref:Cupin superfamily barrel domain protein n=1 Tax=Syntrophotalea carbinolica (strain DSM 2380 / NBRC 103641 / GraBd1) TaxID=338963 RepID=Q3A5Q3_SYNC1|nr:cupin domain-containing protein [Syntrophotalea carbinolica]ABA88304.1 cupin superfamily barrel domain protein [Syntrophotalea carbinolica DSM 2380]
MQRSAQEWIDHLDLIRHPEGGYFRESYRASETIPANALPHRYQGSRHYATTIYYLLQSNDFSALHRLASDEIWHFYSGSPLDIHIIDPGGQYRRACLGNDPQKGQSFQIVITAGCWFGATVTRQDSYTLTGCSVSPGFDFADFELADRQSLIAAYPAHADVIRRLTRR